MHLSHKIQVHYVSTTTHNLQAKIRVHGLDPNSISNIHFHSFKVPHFASPPPNPNAEINFPSHLTPSFDASSHLREPVAALVQSLSCIARKVIVIYDSLMRYVVQDVQNISNMGKPALEKPVLIPEELASIEGCFTTQFMDFMNAQNEFHRFNDGNIFNTTRIAVGLEQSKQKFIWVIRDVDKGDIFDEDGVRKHEVPQGFEERVKGMGLVVREWAPQLEILSHPSTGGFMIHCGWNSCTRMGNENRTDGTCPNPTRI
ncbi:putative trans-zeatin O-beta-D-glucosyltransferase [Lupinus albus]|uniref:Putative trans-zeatin O-beta-D-glucosyltransferase n=1 Tax=Lupinus albus TaxID=3870 RepID=A0A6A4NR92_LUPAL|nr:putative trans-zeatin O-beta-D-glucosyltransferase [Lupinus albus]